MSGPDKRYYQARARSLNESAAAEQASGKTKMAQISEIVADVMVDGAKWAEFKEQEAKRS